MTQELDRHKERPIVFFDFDGTLTTGDTLMPFLKFVVGGSAYYRKLVLVSPVLAAYFARVLRNDIAKQVVLRQYLAGYHIDHLRELGKKFSDEVVPTMLRHEGMERLHWHREHGHECVLVSASIDIYLQGWAKRQGFTHVACTSLESDASGHVTGKIHGRNCYGSEKLTQIKLMFNDASKRIRYAYGDSPGDHEMLGYADHSFVWAGDKFVEYKL